MKRLSLIIAVMAVALACQAQLLWKVSGNGLGRPSYIFGTHHMAPASMIDQIAGMNAAIDGCDIVVGEIEKDSLMSQESQMKMAGFMIAPVDSTLDKLYTPDEYAEVEKVFNKYFGAMGVKLAQMKSLKPNAISTQLQAMQAIKYFPNLTLTTSLTWRCRSVPTRLDVPRWVSRRYRSRLTCFSTPP